MEEDQPKEVKVRLKLSGRHSSNLFPGFSLIRMWGGNSSKDCQKQGRDIEREPRIWRDQMYLTFPCNVLG